MKGNLLAQMIEMPIGVYDFRGVFTSIYNVPNIILGTGNTTMNETKSLISWGLPMGGYRK